MAQKTMDTVEAGSSQNLIMVYKTVLYFFPWKRTEYFYKIQIFL